MIVFALIFWWSIHVCNIFFFINCRWSWWSIHLRNNYFITKKNRRKKKHCSLIVFALIFRQSIRCIPEYTFMCVIHLKKKKSEYTDNYAESIYLQFKKESLQFAYVPCSICSTVASGITPDRWTDWAVCLPPAESNSLQPNCEYHWGKLLFPVVN